MNLSQQVWEWLDRVSVVLGCAIVLYGLFGHGMTLSPGGTVALGILVVLAATRD